MARRDITGAVDFAHLDRLTGGDAAVNAEVLDLFCEQADLWTRVLDPNGDASAWRDGAHTLKGSALGIGAAALAAACAAAEAGWSADADRKSDIRMEIDHALALVMADIAAWRHEQLLRELKSPI